MIIPWILLILGLSHVAVPESSSKEDDLASSAVVEPDSSRAVESTTGSTSTTTAAAVIVTGDAVDGLAISEDEVPPLSVPASSEEISNNPVTASGTRPPNTKRNKARITSTSSPTTSSSTTSSSTASSTSVLTASSTSSPTTSSTSSPTTSSTNALTTSRTSAPSLTARSNPSTIAVPGFSADSSPAEGVDASKQLLERVNATIEERNATESNFSSSSSAATTLPTTKPKLGPKKDTSRRPLSELLSKLSRTLKPRVVQQNNGSELSFNVSLENGTTEAAVASRSAAATISDADQKSIPSIVPNVRITVIGYTGKPVHTFNLTEKQILYQVRLFWLEPENWRDRGFRPPHRLYDLFCWLSNDGAWVRDLLRQNLSIVTFTHSQWFAFPETEEDRKANFTVDCGIRAVNSGGRLSEWSFTTPAEIAESPVFLRGFDNINVKGWSPEEVTHLIKSSSESKRRDALPLSRGTNRKSRRDSVAGSRNCAS